MEENVNSGDGKPEENETEDVEVLEQETSVPRKRYIKRCKDDLARSISSAVNIARILFKDCHFMVMDLKKQLERSGCPYTDFVKSFLIKKGIVVKCDDDKYCFFNPEQSIMYCMFMIDWPRIGHGMTLDDAIKNSPREITRISPEASERIKEKDDKFNKVMDNISIIAKQISCTYDSDKEVIYDIIMNDNNDITKMIKVMKDFKLMGKFANDIVDMIKKEERV